MMTEDLMTTNIRGERPNLSYRDRDVNISIHSQQPVHVLKRAWGRFYVVVLPKYNWAHLHGLKDAGAPTIQDSICAPRGSLGIHVKKCGLLVRCNIWEIISRFWFVASSARFCLFNDVDIKKIFLEWEKFFGLLVLRLMDPWDHHGRRIIEVLSSPNYHKIVSEWQIMREGASR